MQAITIQPYEAQWDKTVSIKQGEKVDVISIEKEWTYVLYNGSKGFVPTRFLTTLDGKSLIDVRLSGNFAPPATSLELMAVVALNYDAETTEALSCQKGSRVRVIQVGEEWSFVADENLKRGFVPSAILFVGDEKIVDHCKRRNLEVVPASNSDSSTGGSVEGGSLTKPFVGSAKSSLVPKNASSAIAGPVWSSLSESEKYRQQMIYGIYHSEYVYNKNLWSLLQIGREFTELNGRLPMLSSDERDALFRDLESLYSLSNQLLGQLTARVEKAEKGVVTGIVDIVEGNLHAFESYLLYCARERQLVQEQIFLQYGALFGHSFHDFLVRLDEAGGGRERDMLRSRIGSIRQYVPQWSYYCKALLQNTSSSQQPLEHQSLRRVHRFFADLTVRLSRSGAGVSSQLRWRVVNYSKLEAHLRGKKLLKESPAKIVTGSGVDYGNQAFLFDGCVVFAEQLPREEAEERPRFRALKKLRLEGLRVVDVAKSTLVLRSSGDRYFLTLPNPSVAIDWRNIISHKNYRYELEVTEYESEELSQVELPLREPEYDAHVSRVERMQNFISNLLGENMPALKPLMAGEETLRLRNGASKRRSGERPAFATTATTRRRSVDKNNKRKEEEEEDEDEEEEARVVMKPQRRSDKLKPQQTTREVDAPQKLDSPKKSPVKANNNANNKNNNNNNNNKNNKVSVHEFTSSEEQSVSGDLDSEKPQQKTPVPSTPVRNNLNTTDQTASQILNAAMYTPAPKTTGTKVSAREVANEEEEEEEMEEESGSYEEESDRVSPQKPVVVAKPVQQPPKVIVEQVSITEEEEEDEWEEEESAPPSAKKEGNLTKVASPPTGTNTSSTATPKSLLVAPAASPAGATPAKKVGDDDSSISDLLSSEDPSVENKNRPKKEEMTQKMFRTLTGQLDNIIAKSAQGSVGGSGEASLEEEEFESEFESSVSQKETKAPQTPASAVIPIARPTAAVFSNSPDDSPARSGAASGNVSGKHTARSHYETGSDEWEYEEEEEEEEESGN